jgi:uncharacterized protein YdeI (BOF family)
VTRKFYLGFTVAALVTALPAFAAGRAEGKHYGAAFTKAETAKLEEITKDADKYNGKTVQVRGEIKDVCQKEGCWIVLTDGTREMRVKMKDHAFVVPKNSSNKKVVVEGVVEKQTISEEMARHYAEEAADKTVKPESIKGPQAVVTMNATGVRIED